MILLADSDGPDQAVQADLGLRCSHMPKVRFSHGVAHINVHKDDFDDAI